VANPLQQLAALGQSVWYDNISRSIIASGQLKKLVEAGEVRGVTSNPTIFEKAIGGSDDYDDDIRRLVRAGKNPEEVFWELAVATVAEGADLLRPLYEDTGGADGYISIEVSPEIARDGRRTVEDAKRLAAWLGRPNVMIKIPATPQCWDAIEECTAAGINVNITMMFAPSHYERVAEAYLRGLERRLASGQDVAHIASVASVFVSRIDTLVDKRLEEAAAAGAGDRATALLGRAAIANAKVIYARFREIFADAQPRWRALAAKGARVQRPLWASTSTKNPRYRDVLYAEALIGPDTVDTMPQVTLDAFREHGVARRTVDVGLDEERRRLADLRALGIDMEDVGVTLQDQGIDLFAESFRKVVHEVEAKARTLAPAGR
jgi:transaldolase